MMNSKSDTEIELKSSKMKFAAGHFTIFSSTNRENLHGHNFEVTCNLLGNFISKNIYNYNIFKDTLANICSELDELFLLPNCSPYLKIIDKGEHYSCIFNQKEMIFLKSDVKILPISNITVEELADWILKKFISLSNIEKLPISFISIKLSSSPAQSALARWYKDKK